MNGAPVPVPKTSLFKATVDPAKAKVKTKPGVPTPKAIVQMAKAIGEPVAAKSILDLPPEPKAAPVGVPLVKATVVPVVIPLGLAESILSKPSTGGGWQAIMGDLQKALVKTAEVADPASSHVLELTPYLLLKLIDKATLYGASGGYQGVMKSIVCFAVKQHPGKVLKILGGGQ